MTNLREELHRNFLRARNGIKWAVGAEFAPEHPTPSDVIWRAGKAEMRRYRRDTPPRVGPPVVAFLGLIGGSHIFDLYKGGSIVEMLVDWGFDAYVMDWGVADELDSRNTLETYLQDYLPQALKAVAKVSGYNEVHFFTYCMGGVMLVHGLAGRAPLAARSVVAIAAPFDLRHLGATFDAIREGKIKPGDLIDDTGNVPGKVLVQSFKRRKPTYGLVARANLWENLWNEEYLEGCQAIGRYLSIYPPLSGALLRQLTQQWMVENAFISDSLRFAGRHASLSNVRAPILAVIAERDEVTPLASTACVEAILPNAKVEFLRANAGHVGLFVGRDAARNIMPSIFKWIESHSEKTL